MDNVSYPDICLVQQSSVTPSTDFASKNTSLIPLAYGIPSLTLSLCIIILLLSNKKDNVLSSTFYTIFAISGISEINEWLFYSLVQRLAAAPWLSPLFAWIPKDGIIVSILYFIVCYVGYLNHIPSLLLTTNRLTSVLLPVNNEKYWKVALKPILAVYFLYPLVFAWQYLFLNQARHCRIWDVNFETSYHVFTSQQPYYGIPLYLGVTIVCYFVSISSLIMNFTTLIVLISHRKHRHTDTNTQRKAYRTEIKMFILTLLMFFNEFSTGIMMMLTYSVSPTSPVRQAILVIQPFVIDLTCLSPPWMLIIMSKKVRSKLFGKVIKGMHSTTMVHAANFSTHHSVARITISRK